MALVLIRAPGHLSRRPRRGLKLQYTEPYTPPPCRGALRRGDSVFWGGHRTRRPRAGCRTLDYNMHVRIRQGYVGEIMLLLGTRLPTGRPSADEPPSGVLSLCAVGFPRALIYRSYTLAVYGPLSLPPHFARFPLLELLPPCGDVW